MLTKADLAAIESRVNATTAGHWLASVRPSRVVGWPVVSQGGRSICSVTYVQHSPTDRAVPGDQAFNAESEANAMFIAAARQDVPALLAHISDIRARVAQIADDFVPENAMDATEALSKQCVALRRLLGEV